MPEISEIIQRMTERGFGKNSVFIQALEELRVQYEPTGMVADEPMTPAQCLCDQCEMTVEQCRERAKHSSAAGGERGKVLEDGIALIQKRIDGIKDSASLSGSVIGNDTNNP